jgi:hypothetical protein
LYVYTMSMLQCAAGSFKVLGVVVGVELGVVLAYVRGQVRAKRAQAKS